jgi:nucleotide-binding universal stress UspA family protein
VPYAVKAARWLSARLLLFQALPQVGASTQGLTDILESSYLQRKSAEIRSACKIDPQWEVLHGEAGDAICRYLKDMPETLLAMTTHARAPAQRFVLGSVSAYCVRHAGVPLLLYWPPEQKGSH